MTIECSADCALCVADVVVSADVIHLWYSKDTGLPNSDTYADIAFADAYCTKYGIASWSDVALPGKEVALRAATRALDVLYGARYVGTQLTQLRAAVQARLDALGLLV